MESPLYLQGSPQKAANCFCLSLLTQRKINRPISNQARNTTLIYSQWGDKICVQVVQNHLRGLDCCSYGEVYLNANKIQKSEICSLLLR